MKKDNIFWGVLLLFGSGIYIGAQPGFTPDTV